MIAIAIANGSRISERSFGAVAPPTSMRTLLCHCRNYGSEITGLSNRPIGVSPEAVTEPAFQTSDAVAVLITVEPGDNVELFASQLAGEIRKMCHDTGHAKVVLLPFAHLSAALADSETSIRMIDGIAGLLSDLSPVRIHFGSDKSLQLDIYGHPGNVRYREFY